jgi:hypothetical protein
MPPLSRHDGPYAGDRMDWPRIFVPSRHSTEENGAAAARHRQVRELTAMIGVAGVDRHRPVNLFGGHNSHQLMRSSLRPKRERERSGGRKCRFQTVRAADDERGAGNALGARARGQARWQDSGLSSACRFRRGQSRLWAGASNPEWHLPLPFCNQGGVALLGPAQFDAGKADRAAAATARST